MYRYLLFTLGLLVFCLAVALPARAGVIRPLSIVPRASNAVDDAKGLTSSVAYQFNTLHTGDAAGKLRLPLKQLWAVNLGGPVGYPVEKNGVVVVSANGSLTALNASTGATLWSQPAPTGGGWVGPAYGGGMIFSNVYYTNGSSGIGMFAFNLTSGAQVWSQQLHGQYAFSSPPTAFKGSVYTGGAGSGGTVYAFSQSTGSVLWTAQVANGDNSSPVVTSTGVFVSYVCPQSYDFNPANGSQIWHYSGPCEGGGGSTGVLYDKLLFVEDSAVVSGYNGIALTASSGQPYANFNSNFPPAFSNHVGYFVTNSTTLVASNIPEFTQAWTASLSGDTYATPPFIVGSTVYIETASGQLYGYAATTGVLKTQLNLGYSDNLPGFSAGLGYGNHTLFVPAGNELIALQST